jgi:hypothetical protein
VLLKIFATADRGVARASGPSLIVEADHVAALPHHPTGKAWRYLATISDSDTLIVSRRDIIEAALATRGFFASRWALGIGSSQSHTPSLQHRHPVSGGRGLSYQRQRAEEAFRLPA